GIWKQVLGEDTVIESDSHFFQLGGNSLLILKIQLLIFERFHIDLPLSLIFKRPFLRDLAKAVENGSESDNSVPLSVPLSNSTSFPLTNEQTRIYLTQMFEQSNCYNVPLFFTLPPDVLFEQLTEAVRNVIQAHPALRMRLIEEQGEIKQQLLDSDEIDIGQISVHPLEWSCLQQRLSIETVDLEKGVCNIYFVKIEGEESVLVLNVHHIAIDGQSIDTLTKALNKALASEQLSTDDGFIRHALWQQTQEYDLEISKQIVYWKNRFNLVDGTTVVPYLTTPSDSKASAYSTFSLSTELVLRCREMARTLGVSEFTYWSGIVSLVIGRLSQSNFVTLLTPVAKRVNHTEIDSIGFFANTIPLFSQWVETHSFEAFIKKRQLELTEDFCHQLLSYDKIKQVLNCKERLSEVLFSLSQNVPYSNLAVGRNEGVKFDFAITMNLETRSPIIEFEYRACAYSANAVESFFATLVYVAEQVSECPRLLLNQVQLVKGKPIIEAQVALTLEDKWISVPHQIIQMAEHYPDILALTVGAEKFSYEEVKVKATRVAGYIQSIGIGKGHRVAIMMSRTAELPISLLGILLSGAAYVPLDPDYPLERNRYILEDADVHLGIHNGEIVSDLEQINWLNIAEIETTNSEFSFEPIAIFGDDTSHIIYTSGSTGRPKGVVISHQGVTALQNWARQTYSGSDLQCVYASTSICFDLSIFEILVTWSLGGRFHFACNILQLIDDVETLPITLINTVPSLLNEVLRFIDLPDKLKVVNLAGEPLSKSLAQNIMENSEATRLYNLYGPSEDTTYSTAFLVKDCINNKIFIGSPINGTGAKVCDSDGREVPNYFTGELYLSGHGLAKGYWNNQKLTQEKFVQDSRGVIYYKTGDLVRYENEGNLFYIGRKDDQIKLRGFRIELGEIDSVLQTYRGVVESCTMEVNIADSKKLIAFITVQGEGINGNVLSNYLRERLPNFMIPEQFKMIRRFPLTPSGKKDRQALRRDYLNWLNN
uniref:non-ribosomal peptide synthetase n=1 Tax=uncultured Shewanella sp. TaxID=173975 RepID=UPI002624DC96